MNGLELYERRRFLQLTQAEMAKGMGCSLRTYIRLEQTAEAPLATKYERMLVGFSATAVQAAPKRDKRFKDWVADYGKPVFIYIQGQEVGAEQGCLKGDPCGRSRAKTLEAARLHVDPPGAIAPYPWGKPKRIEDRDDSWHIFIS